MTSFGETYLPPEVVETILSELDPKTFVICRRVCKTWNEIVLRLSQDTDIWDRFVKNYFDWRVKTIYLKGELDWPSVYYNWHLWKEIASADITLHQVEGLGTLPVRYISITREGKLLITLKDKVMQVNAQTLVIENSIHGRYLRYDQSEYVTALHADTESLYLTDCFNQRIIDTVQFYSLHEDICYYTTYEQKLYKYVCKRTIGRPEFLARWYGSDVITELRMYEGQVYLLTNAGKLLTYSKQRLLQVGGFTWPRSNLSTTREVFHLFGGKNLLYCNNTHLHVCFDGNIILSKELKSNIEVTCMLLHANFLFIGTYWGEINLYYYDQLSDLQDTDLGKPSYQHILSNGDSEPIGDFNIYEEKGCHSLLVQTRKNVFVIKFNHLKKSGVEMMIKSKNCLLGSII